MVNEHRELLEDKSCDFMMHDLRLTIRDILDYVPVSGNIKRSFRFSTSACRVYLLI